METRAKFYFVEDIMEITGLSRSKSYKVIQNLNKELAAEGYITIAGRVPQKKFNERFYCDIDPKPVKRPANQQAPVRIAAIG